MKKAAEKLTKEFVEKMLELCPPTFIQTFGNGDIVFEHYFGTLEIQQLKKKHKIGDKVTNKDVSHIALRLQFKALSDLNNFAKHVIRCQSQCYKAAYEKARKENDPDYADIVKTREKFKTEGEFMKEVMKGIIAQLCDEIDFEEEIKFVNDYLAAKEKEVQNEK